MLWNINSKSELQQDVEKLEKTVVQPELNGSTAISPSNPSVAVTDDTKAAGDAPAPQISQPIQSSSSMDMSGLYSSNKIYSCSVIIFFVVVNALRTPKCIKSFIRYLAINIITAYYDIPGSLQTALLQLTETLVHRYYECIKIVNVIIPLFLYSVK